MKLNFSSAISNLKYSFFDAIKESKKTCFLMFLLALVGILTGVFTAINYCNGATLANFSNFSLNKFLLGELATLELFFNRLLSYTAVVVIVSLTTFSVYLSPISFFLVAYRGYLLSLNVSIMVILYGIGGILAGIFVVLPCQLLSLIIISLYSCFVFKRAQNKKCYGATYKLLPKFFITIFALTLVNLVETLLLAVFSTRVIFVI